MQAVLSRTDSGIRFRNSAGQDVTGTLLHITPQSIAFEIYSPYVVVEPGDTLTGLSVTTGGQTIFTGSARVAGVLSAGRMTIVTASAIGPEARFARADLGQAIGFDADDLSRRLAAATALQPAFQVAVLNIRTFLTELSGWVAPLEATGAPAMLMDGIAAQLFAVVQPRLQELFNRFEQAARELDEADRPAHMAFARRELHPLTLCSPFVYRTFTKPMGYAGDYETVNMILRNRMEGATLYAKLVNAYFLSIDAARGHRNRISKLTDMLSSESRRAVSAGRRMRVLNLGCGPAEEVCRFIRTDASADGCELTLLDFNDETLAYAREQVTRAAVESGREITVEYINRSVLDMVRDRDQAGLVGSRGGGDGYELVYCAGLFDYLSDKVCARLLRLMGKQVRAGGRLVATNVHPRHDSHAALDSLGDWRLICRSEADMLALSPDAAGESAWTEEAGVNVFLDIRKSEIAHGERRSRQLLQASP